ncbi:hypothetical protein TNCV_3388031 [Trichonephila clavipes]|nr:hypothetical protein TNCV_3388031 [Trichonephila clavipes]
MGWRNASRSVPSDAQHHHDEGERILERIWLVSPRCDVVFGNTRLRGKRSAMYPNKSRELFLSETSLGARMNGNLYSFLRYGGKPNGSSRPPSSESTPW